VQSPFGGVGFWVGNFAVTFLEQNDFNTEKERTFVGQDLGCWAFLGYGFGL